MKVLRPGHRFELANFEDTEAPGQIIQFIEKTRSDFTGEFKTVHDGTTNEEVAEVLINRLEQLNSKFACTENELAIQHFKEGLFWLNERTKNRISRNVEGKPLA